MLSQFALPNPTSLSSPLGLSPACHEEKLISNRLSEDPIHMARRASVQSDRTKENREGGRTASTELVPSHLAPSTPSAASLTSICSVSTTLSSLGNSLHHRHCSPKTSTSKITEGHSSETNGEGYGGGQWSSQPGGLCALAPLGPGNPYFNSDLPSPGCPMTSSWRVSTCPASLCPLPLPPPLPSRQIIFPPIFCPPFSSSQLSPLASIQSNQTQRTRQISSKRRTGHSIQSVGGDNEGSFGDGCRGSTTVTHFACGPEELASEGLSGDCYLDSLALTIWQFFLETRQTPITLFRKLQLRNALHMVVSGAFHC
ncbi:unnamed protein product [Protopolystoma xenopodis]|uniref:Uncharacterized protein n=1 Tax=Protopolystoma xenopodis TaxID=117903 RepID=A0A3S5BSZ3_9PLAT|nr:unnamed protein product [Protopolystoma xenopodis]